LDKEDIENIKSWYLFYKKLYSYPSDKNLIITNEQKQILEKHEKEK
jgi:hypothetical protein